MDASINSNQVVSLYGRLQSVLLPVEALMDMEELARALVAWRYDLVRQEVDLLEHVALGLTNAEIASCLHVAEENTVKNRLRVVFRKLGVSNRHRASAVAMHYGLGLK